MQHLKNGSCLQTWCKWQRWSKGELRELVIQLCSPAELEMLHVAAGLMLHMRTMDEQRKKKD